MEENKDFDTSKKKEQGEGKKAMVRIFGHEFDKKKAVMAGLGGGLWFSRWRAGASPTP